MWFPLFLFFLFIIPFSFALNPVEGVDLPIIRILIPLLFLLWFFEGLVNKKIFIDIRIRFFALLSFVFLALISLFWAIEPSFGTRKAIYFVSFLPLYFLGFAATRTTVLRNKVLLTICSSGFVLSIFALVQFSLQFFVGIDNALNIIKAYIPFFLGESFSNLVFAYPSWMVNISGLTLIRAFATFPDPHLFSIYINMVIPLTLLLFFKTKKRFFLLAALIMFLSSIASFSRASYLAILSAFLFFIFSSYGIRVLKNNFSLSIFLTLLALLFLVIPNPFTARFFDSFSFNEGSNYGRIEMWQNASGLIKDNPMGGVGIGNFSYYIDPTIDLRNPIYAHNILLDFGSEMGLFAIFLLFILLFSPIFKFYSRPSDLSLAIAISFVVFFIHSLFETPFFSVRVFSLYLVLLSFNTND